MLWAASDLCFGDRICAGRLWEPKTLLFPMLQRDLGVRKQGMCANLSSGPKNGTGNIQNPIATARFRCPETGTVCKFVHRSQKRDGNYSKSYCYGAISDDQNREVQKCANWRRFKSEILIVTCISTSSKHDAHAHARTDERTDSFSGVVRIWGSPLAAFRSLSDHSISKGAKI